MRPFRSKWLFMGIFISEPSDKYHVFSDHGPLTAKDLERLLAWLKKAQKHCARMNKKPKTSTPR